jgi:hypothetical protein
MQAEECPRLLALPQSEASARLLTNLSRTWVMLANQTDRLRRDPEKGSCSEKVRPPQLAARFISIPFSGSKKNPPA